MPPAACAGQTGACAAQQQRCFARSACLNARDGRFGCADKRRMRIIRQRQVVYRIWPRRVSPRHSLLRPVVESGRVAPPRGASYLRLRLQEVRTRAGACCGVIVFATPAIYAAAPGRHRHRPPSFARPPPSGLLPCSPHFVAVVASGFALPL